MMKLEHVGIAVDDESAASTLFARLLGAEAYKSERVEREGVNTTFFSLNNTKLELLASLTTDTPVDRFILKRGEGIHHLAFAVDDIYAEIKRLKDAGFKFINEIPKDGADNKIICFLHPKSTHGVLVELCQDKG